MNLYAFDCDGTLEHGGGPIGLRTLKRLEKQGHIVVIVSDSPVCSCLWNTVFPYISGAEEGLSRTKARKRALLRTKKIYDDCDKYIYVSDDAGDHKIADKTGYEYIHPEDFYGNRVNPKKRHGFELVLNEENNIIESDLVSRGNIVSKGYIYAYSNVIAKGNIESYACIWMRKKDSILQARGNIVVEGGDIFSAGSIKAGGTIKAMGYIDVLGDIVAERIIAAAIHCEGEIIGETIGRIVNLNELNAYIDAGGEFKQNIDFGKLTKGYTELSQKIWEVTIDLEGGADKYDVLYSYKFNKFLFYKYPNPILIHLEAKLQFMLIDVVKRFGKNQKIPEHIYVEEKMKHWEAYYEGNAYFIYYFYDSDKYEVMSVIDGKFIKDEELKNEIVEMIEESK